MADDTWAHRIPTTCAALRLFEARYGNGITIGPYRRYRAIYAPTDIGLIGRGRLLDVVDDEDFNRAFFNFEPETELFL